MGRNINEYCAGSCTCTNQIYRNGSFEHRKTTLHFLHEFFSPFNLQFVTCSLYSRSKSVNIFRLKAVFNILNKIRDVLRTKMIYFFNVRILSKYSNIIDFGIDYKQIRINILQIHLTCRMGN